MGEACHASISQSDEHSEARQRGTGMSTLLQDESARGMSGGENLYPREGEQRLCPENRIRPQVQYPEPNQITESV